VKAVSSWVIANPRAQRRELPAVVDRGDQCVEFGVVVDVAESGDEVVKISFRACIVPLLQGGDFASWCRLDLHPDCFAPGLVAVTLCICSFPFLRNG